MTVPWLRIKRYSFNLGSVKTDYYFDGSSVTEAHTSYWQKSPGDRYDIEDEFKIDDEIVTQEEEEAFRDTLGSFALVDNRVAASELQAHISGF